MEVFIEVLEQWYIEYGEDVGFEVGTVHFRWPMLRYTGGSLCK